MFIIYVFDPPISRSTMRYFNFSNFFTDVIIDGFVNPVFKDNVFKDGKHVNPPKAKFKRFIKTILSLLERFFVSSNAFGVIVNPFLKYL